MTKRAKARKTKSRYRSTTEEKFARLLESQRLASEIQGWKYEPMRLNLGGGAWYKPDFEVIELDHTITLFEVKGFWRQAGRVRIKVAAANYPEFRFVGVRWIKGAWEFEEFSADEEDTNGTD